MTLKELIAQHTVTHEMLATRIGCHPSALSNWINGKRRISARDADKIARTLGVRAFIRNGGIEFEKTRQPR